MKRFTLKYLTFLFVTVVLVCTKSFAQKYVIQQPDSTNSLQKKISGQVNETGKKTIGGIKESVMQVADPGKHIMDSLLNSGRNMFRTVIAPVNIFKPGSPVFRINNTNADVEYTYLNDTSGISTGYLKNLQSTVGYNLAVDLSVANMPFDIRLTGSNGIYDFYHSSFRNFPQFNFNHEEYLESLQQKVLTTIKPETILASALTKINTIKSQYEASLRNEIKEIQQQFESEFGSSLGVRENITDLSVNDLASLRTQIIPGEVEENYSKAKLLYQELNNSTDNGGNVIQRDSLKQTVLQQIKKRESLEKIYSRVIGWKDKFDNNSLVKELRSHLPFTPGNFKSYIKKPGNLVDIIKQQTSLSGIQRLFLNITKLDLGTNQLGGGELDLKNIVNNGINTEFTGKRSSAGIVYGSGKANMNQWMQAGLNSFVSNEYSRLMGIKFGSGWNSKMQQSVSLNFFDFNSFGDLSSIDPTQLQAGYFSAPGHRDAVITWQSSFDVSPDQHMSVDLSKSFGSYNNSFSGDSTVSKNNAFGDLMGNDGKSNFAIAVDYRGNFLKTDVGLSFKKAGLGYNNPGNVFVRKGESRVGFNVGRQFFKQKLRLQYKMDYRSQHFDPSRNHTYKNVSGNLQASYRIKRNTRFGLAARYNSYRFNNETYGTSLSGSGFSFQGDGNYQFRVKSKRVINNFIITRQTLNIPMLTGDQYLSKTWLVSHTSSVVLNKNIMTVILLLNRSDNSNYYFNTSFFNAETGYAYALNEKVRLNSAVGFYSNTGWNKQVGLKQQVSGTLFKKLDVDIDISWKKAVEITRHELANQVFISSSVHYRF